MKIQIKKYIQGAKEAEGVTVVIDVFRASNTILACLASGAEYILPIGEIEKALEFKKQNPNYLLLGERDGITIPGFDYGNSPTEMSDIDLRGKKIILTTSAGTQGIVNANKADEILIGSFANAEAMVKYIQKINPTKVTLLAIGENGTKPAVEDELCAKYLKAKLENRETDFNLLRADILNSPGASRLRNLRQDKDLDFGLHLNIIDIIPKHNRTDKTIISEFLK